jgi:hypothetical protein
MARYTELLEPAAAKVLAEAVVGLWIPLDVALAHYRACDALGLSPEAQASLGRGTNDRIKGVFYGTFLKLVTESGVTPWTVMPHWQRFWNRVFDGGTVSIVKTGPKDARLEVGRCSLLESPYFRNALRGLVAGLTGLFCTRPYATEMRDGRSKPDRLVIRIQWV